MFVDSLLREVCHAQALRYACSRQIFCPVCETILDCESAILTKPIGDPPKIRCLCVGCFETQFDKTADTIRRTADPDPYGLHGLSNDHRRWTIEQELIAAYDRVVDLDGRELTWD